MRRPPFYARGTPVAAILAILLSGAVFLGIPIWLGYAGHGLIWIAAWSLVVAPMSPDGLDVLVELKQPPREPLSIGHQLARGGAILARIGAIGMASYGIGCLAR